MFGLDGIGGVDVGDGASTALRSCSDRWKDSRVSGITTGLWRKGWGKRFGRDLKTALQLELAELQDVARS
jgi:hypothetical protein